MHHIAVRIAVLALLTTPILAQGSAGQTLGSGQVSMALDPHVQEQLELIYREKESRTAAQKKLDTPLVVTLREFNKDRLAVGLPHRPFPFRQDKANRIEVDMKATVTPELLQAIRDAGGRIENSFPQYRSVRAFLSLAAIGELAERQDVTRIRTAARLFLTSVIDKKVNTSQGDVAHAANLARSLYGVNGSGVKVGVISDSVDELAAVQASGDLPAVTVLPGQSGNGTGNSSEGTAMLEIVYDLAPGAQLYFATADGGESNFANNILALHDAGCQVIVDDVGYFDEGVFQDTVVAQAVNTVTAAGVAYFSSAGNSGRLDASTAGVWEGDYKLSGSYITVPPGTGTVTKGGMHDWGGGVTYNQITQAASSSSAPIVLQWSDAFGASASDYDLLILNSAQTLVLHYSNETQDGTGDPLEGINGPQETGDKVVVVNFDSTAGHTSPQPSRFLHLDTNRGRLQKATNGSTWGHSAAANAFSIAAVDVASAGSAAFTGGSANPVENFSSDGPRKIFYNANGSAVTPGNYLATGGINRQKPDLAAADGVACATPHFNPFYGTSAAAPHAAAIAALMYDADPGLSLSALRSALTSTALDVNPAGVDRNSGYGIIEAADAVGAVSGTPSTCVRDATTACLLSGRFEVRVNWANTTSSGAAQVMYFNAERAESDQSAFYYFQGATNFEMGVKVLNGCGLTNHYWVFASGLTDQGWTLTVKDTSDGTTKIYSNAVGHLSTTFADTSALATCP